MLSSELLANIIVCTFGSDSFRSSPIRNIRLFERSSVFSRFNNGKFCKDKKEGEDDERVCEWKECTNVG